MAKPSSVCAKCRHLRGFYSTLFYCHSLLFIIYEANDKAELGVCKMPPSQRLLFAVRALLYFTSCTSIMYFPSCTFHHYFPCLYALVVIAYRDLFFYFFALRCVRNAAPGPRLHGSATRRNRSRSMIVGLFCLCNNRSLSHMY